MTQFQPPPYPPASDQQDYFPTAQGPSTLPRWSAAAIGGFVLSLLGFLGATAVLGLIFGIVGIITTSGGRRRGMGLAIAAIPISLVMGLLSVLLLSAVLIGTRAVAIPVKLQGALGADSASVADSAHVLREIGSASFNEEVSEETLQAWIKQINAKHGKLTSASLDAHQMMSKAHDGSVYLNINGKFINGPAAIRLTFKEMNVWSLRIEDIEIGGSSPREDAQNAPMSTKKEPTSATP